MKKVIPGLAIAFVVLGVVLRFAPHFPNFAPIAAIALFGGVYLNKKYALIIPIVAMAISDYFIGFYDIKLMLGVYLSFVLVGVVGLIIKKKKNIFTVIGGSVLGSVLFFLITNFSVWAFYNWYPHTLSGLSQCFLMAVPFFRNTLLGDLFYVAVLFGVYELITARARRKYLVIEKAQEKNIIGSILPREFENRINKHQINENVITKKY